MVWRTENNNIVRLAWLQLNDCRFSLRYSSYCDSQGRERAVATLRFSADDQIVIEAESAQALKHKLKTLLPSLCESRRLQSLSL